MPKKEFAIFSTGWSSAILCDYLKGMQEALSDKEADIFLFLTYPPGAAFKELVDREFNIFNLPDLKSFDGIIVFSSSIHQQFILNPLLERCVKSGVPTISRGVEYEGTYNLHVDNRLGMIELCEHLIKDHGVKRPAFICGSSESDDSNVRFEVMKEVFKKHNINFDEDLVTITEWDNYLAIQFINSLKERNIEMPDAVICANDGLAMASVMALNELGYRVPEDIIVTGFDYINDSRSFYPSISTVDQQFTELGRKGANILWDIATGENIKDRDFTIPCKFIPGESCGCGHLRDSEADRRMAGRKAFWSRSEDNFSERKLNAFEHEIVAATNYEKLYDKCQHLMEGTQILDTDTIHVLLNPSAFKDKSHKRSGTAYAKTMNVLFTKTDGKLGSEKTFKSMELIPGYEPDSPNHLYTFLPLYDDDANLGYVVTRDSFDHIESRKCQRYQARLSMSLSKFRQNLSMTNINGQLVQLAKIDSLTNMKNRVAYEEDMSELDALIKSGHAPEFSIIMFDINNLKDINDKLGHEAGDEYIIASCRLICSVFNHSPVYRIGGDEFVCVLKDNDNRDKERLLSNMVLLMDSLRNNPTISPEKQVSIAYGCAEYQKDDKEALDVFNRADKLMYENKLKTKGKCRDKV